MASATPIAADLKTRLLSEALGERYLAYALSTIMSRSLPDVRDGLKPVQRRILHAMRLLKLDPEGGYRKCAKVVGDVIGGLHPHGDAPVYDALVRLAQEFALRYPLVDGQGNFGNVDGDNAAAMRYTEAKLTPIAALLMEGIDEATVDFRSTYDGQAEEPVVFPAGFPNLLANGAAGIAVGMATSIPPHNVADLCDALLHLIKTPSCSIDTLVGKLGGPDFPTGGMLAESPQAIREAYATGRGSFRLRATWKKEEQKAGAWRIVVTEIPYQVQKARLIEKIAELLLAKKLPLVGDVYDESDERIRLVIEPKSRNVDPDHMMESLFRSTDLEARIPLNMNVLDKHTVPRVMNLKEVLQAYLDHRIEVLQKRSKHRLAVIDRRIEVLKGHLIVYLNLDEVIRIIREEDEPKQALVARFKLTEVQVEAILNMRLRSLRKLEEMELKRENAALSKERKELDALLKDEDAQKGRIGDEVKALREAYGPRTPLGRRRTVITEAPSAVIIPLASVIEREPVTIVCSAQGWLRAVRGHVDGAEIKYKEGDGERFLLRGETTDKILLFATDGRFFTLAVDKLPRGRGFGDPIRLSIDLGNEDDILACLLHTPAPEGAPVDSGRRLLLASTEGNGFQVAEGEVLASTRAGRQIMVLGEGAKARACLPTAGDHVAVLSESRKLLVFPLEQVPAMAKGRGVILQKYKTGGLLKEGLADIAVFALKDGLPVEGNGRRQVFDVKDWIGNRAGQGSTVPRGWPRVAKLR